MSLFRFNRLLLFLVFTGLPTLAFSQVAIDTIYAYEAVKQLIDSKSIHIFNVKYTGASSSLGVFKDTSNQLGFTEGIMLSSGSIFFAEGPNKSEYTSWVSQQYGDEDLNSIAHGKTYDAAVLEFDFIPASEWLEFEYVFASEEYDEYVGSKFNDVFGFWINEKGSNKKINVGTITEDKIPVTVNTINSEINPELYLSNKYFNTVDPILWDTRKRKVITNKNYGKEQQDAPFHYQFDGFTKVLKARLLVIPGKTYHIKMAIGDVADAIYDSWVVIQGKSFRSYGEKVIDLKIYKIPELTKIDNNNLAKWEDVVNYVPEMHPVHLKKWNLLLRSRVHFEFDQYGLRQDESQFLNKIIEKLLAENEYLIYILGHTDSDGSDEYNIRLSQNRTQTVYKKLIKKGVPKDRIIIDHYGEYLPVDTNETDAGRAVNRRVEIFVYRLL